MSLQDVIQRNNEKLNQKIGFMKIHTAEQLETYPDEAANLFAEIDRLKAARYYFGMEARHDEQLAK
nr:MAG TPA: hypothetical protein [Caudoviricetes sp.]